MNEHKAYNGVVYELKDAFADVEKAEDRLNQFNMEAEAIHKKTVEAWDRLFDAIAEITRTHENSQALRDSKMRQYLPQPQPKEYGNFTEWYGDKIPPPPEPKPSANPPSFTELTKS